ncbi:hypothetical protein [Nannocystis pusilla]|uniref:hypothetical protein n=1 Tax=Nannocystis pusilla TaxID=889268 RepID=UPI003B763CEA
MPLLAEVAGRVELEVVAGDEPVQGGQHGQREQDDEADEDAALAVGEVVDRDAAEGPGDAVGEHEAQREQAERAAGQGGGRAPESCRLEGHATRRSYHAGRQADD